jgi:hypothetical protein
MLVWEDDETPPADLVRGSGGRSSARRKAGSSLAGEAPAEDEQRHGHEGVPDEVPEEVQRA